jgi:hypothetical protein
LTESYRRYAKQRRTTYHTSVFSFGV